MKRKEEKQDIENNSSKLYQYLRCIYLTQINLDKIFIIFETNIQNCNSRTISLSFLIEIKHIHINYIVKKKKHKNKRMAFQ